MFSYKLSLFVLIGSVASRVITRDEPETVQIQFIKGAGIGHVDPTTNVIVKDYASPIGNTWSVNDLEAGNTKALNGRMYEFAVYENPQSETVISNITCHAYPKYKHASTQAAVYTINSAGNGILDPQITGQYTESVLLECNRIVYDSDFFQ